MSNINRLLEKSLWKKIKAYLPGKAERLENMVGTGITDIHGFYIRDYWIELKVCKNKIKDCNVVSLLEDYQKIWHKEYGEIGALILVLVEYPSKMVLYKFKYKEDSWPSKMEECYIQILSIYSPYNLVLLNAEITQFILSNLRRI